MNNYKVSDDTAKLVDAVMLLDKIYSICNEAADKTCSEKEVTKLINEELSDNIENVRNIILTLIKKSVYENLTKIDCNEI